MSVAEWMIFVGRLTTLPHPEQDQPTVAGINNGMYCLRQHGGTAGDRGRYKLRDGDREVSGDSCIDRECGFRSFLHDVSTGNPSRLMIFSALVVGHGSGRRR